MPDSASISTFLAPHGLSVQQFTTATPTAEAAANAVGCPLGAIAKTLLFLVGGKPLVVISAGDSRVNSSRLKKACGQKGAVRLPAPEDVERLTGYRPGAVSPFLLPAELPCYLDTTLRRFATIYPAGGDDHSAVALDCDTLLTLCGAIEVDVCTLPDPAGVA